MAGEDTGKYRKRVEEDTGGLIKEPVQRGAATGGLAFEKFDDPAETASLVLTSIADRMVAPDDGADAGLEDFGIGLLLAEQRSGRVSELLKRAHQLISAGQRRPALVVVEEALAADIGCGEAWALKGRCLTELGLHEAALRVLRHARSQVSDPQLRIVILKLEADCVQASTRVLETRLMQMREQRQLPEALKLVNEGLRSQPSNIVFLYHLANLQWLSGAREAAQQAIEEAHRHVGRENIDLIAGLERQIEFGTNQAAVEAARAALRKEDAAAALRHLDSCAAALRGNEHYDGLRAYAERKRRPLGQFLGGAAPQQQILRWLLSEEIREADEALREGDFARARAALEQAGRLEPECAAACYKHARAIWLSCRQVLDQKGPADTRIVAEDLKAAELLASRAASDPGYQEQASGLLKSIKGLRARVR